LSFFFTSSSVSFKKHFYQQYFKLCIVACCLVLSVLLYDRLSYSLLLFLCCIILPFYKLNDQIFTLDFQFNFFDVKCASKKSMFADIK